MSINFTIRTTVPIALKNINKKLNALPKEAYAVFKSNTPIKTGNARSKTKLQNNQTINADYAYAGVLDKGRSKQAPRGMTKPTVDFIKKRVEQIVRGK